MAFPVDVESIKTLFEQIKSSCPNLSFAMPPPKWIDEVTLFMGLEKQSGLPEPVPIYLSDDCLNMYCGEDFWMEVFPCSNQAVVDNFERSVVGFLNGDFQIIKKYRYGTYIGGILAPLGGVPENSLYSHNCINVEFFCFWKAIKYQKVAVSKASDVHP